MGSSLSKLTAEELAQYRKEFDAVDKDKSGSLSKAELVEAFKRCGAVHADVLADGFMAQHDSNKDGSISWKEFIAKYEEARVEKAERFESTVEALKAKFKGHESGVDEETLANLVGEMESAGDLQLGFANSIRYQATHSTQTVFTEKEVEAIIQRLTFADKPASSGLGGAGATA